MKKIIILLLTTNLLSFSQTVILDTNNITIGDQTSLHVTLEIPVSEEYNWPDFSDSIFSKIEIIEKGEINKETFDSIEIIKQSVIITCFDSGTYIIPSIIFNETKKSNQLKLNVNTYLITDSTKIQDISNIKIGERSDLSEKEIKELWLKRIKKILILVVIIFVIILSYLLLKKLKKHNYNINKKNHPDVPAHITALNKLNNLEKQKLWQKGETKEYYSIISNIIREYIEGRFQISALELPTNDIEKLIRNSIEKKLLETLKEILSRADSIKYAKGISLEKENIKVMIDSINFIKQTKIDKNESIS